MACRSCQFVASWREGAVSSAFGVGGAILLMSLLVSVLKLPIFVVARTSVFSVPLSSAVCVGHYLKGAVVAPGAKVDMICIGLGYVFGEFMHARLVFRVI